jgi:hypothetical protein
LKTLSRGSILIYEVSLSCFKRILYNHYAVSLFQPLEKVDFQRLGFYCEIWIYKHFYCSLSLLEKASKILFPFSKREFTV